MEHFSERETEVINIIGRNKNLTIKKITGIYYSSHIVLPFNSEQLIRNSISTIRNKCNYHNLNWTLEKQKKDGSLIIFKTKKEK